MEPYRQRIGQVGSGAPLASPMPQALTAATSSTPSWQSSACSPVPCRRRHQHRTCSELVVSGCMAHRTWHSYRTQRQHLWAKQGDTGPAAELLCTSQHSLTGHTHLGTSLPACAHAGTALGRGCPFLMSSIASVLLALAPTALPRQQPLSWHNRGPPAVGHGKLISMIILGARGSQTPASAISSASTAAESCKTPHAGSTLKTC